MMRGHEQSSLPTVDVTSQFILKGIPEAFTYIAEGIDRARQHWELPHLNDLWIILSNVARPLSEIHDQDISNQRLMGWTEERGLIPKGFGVIEARGYEQLLQLTQADRVLMLSTATVEYEKDNTNTLANYAAFRNLARERIAPSVAKRCQMPEIILGGSGSGKAIIVSCK
jgi:hypothetical protein